MYILQSPFKNKINLTKQKWQIFFTRDALDVSVTSPRYIRKRILSKPKESFDSNCYCSSWISTAVEYNVRKYNIIYILI